MIMVSRVQTLYTPTFDFGLFTQMFYNMKNLNGMAKLLQLQERELFGQKIYNFGVQCHQLLKVCINLLA